jgi:hypothetical protein
MKASLSQRLLLVFSILFFVASACSLPTQRTEEPAVDENLAQTAAVETIDALMTEIAGKNITSTPGPQVATATTEATPYPTLTLAPTSTPQPTSTAIVLPTATATSALPCNQAAFVTDVNIPDGTQLTANTQFSKTWRIKNTGRCTWTTDYALVYDSGNGMSGPAEQKLTAQVLPGQTVDITVLLRAPANPGSYRGHWKLRNASGVLFGLGINNQTFYVDIKVVAVNTAAGYDFTANYCAAEWTGNGKAISCQGKDGDKDGFVLYRTKPVLENGSVDNEPALITNPPLINDGVIRGKYPSYLVKPEDRFKSVIGCERNATKCSVRFQLDYQIDNGAIQTFATWNEAYDSMLTFIDIDLSPLAGKNVSFILTVLANGPSDNDRAQWLLPRIQSMPPTPTPTVTPTVTLTPTPTETSTPEGPGYP